MKQEKDKLTIEESQELINLGIPWYYSTIFRTDVPARVTGYHDTHIFTFNNLLSLLPLSIQLEGENLILTFMPLVYGKDREEFWRAGYSNSGTYSPEFIIRKELIDAIFVLVKWCIKEGYIKPENL